MRIWLNGKWYDMNFLTAIRVAASLILIIMFPTPAKTNFYYYEASNGVGKVRGSMIDSPDNRTGFVFRKLDNNEIVLLDKEGKEIWNYPTGRDWVEGVAISKDGNYIACRN